MPFDPENMSLPDEAATLSDFLMLDRPFLDQTVTDFMQLPGSMESFIEELSLPASPSPPSKVDRYLFETHRSVTASTSPTFSFDIMDGLVLSCRPVDLTIEEAKKSWTVMSVISYNSTTASILVNRNKFRILDCLLRTLEPDARGSIVHFSRAFMAFCQKQTDITKIAISETSKGVPLQLALLQYVIHPEIADCLVFFVKNEGGRHMSKQSRINDYLIKIRFIEAILDLAVLKDQPAIALAASELFVRVYRDSLTFSQGFMLFLSLAGENTRLAKLMKATFGSNSAATNGSESADTATETPTSIYLSNPRLFDAWIEIFESIVLPKTHRIVLAYPPGNIPSYPIHPEPYNTAIKLFQSNLDRFDRANNALTT
eukprot:jgi/Hompol1/7087/HPOL_005199-RA